MNDSVSENSQILSWEMYSRRSFLKYVAGSISVMYAGSFGFGSSAGSTKTPTYPIRADVNTTLDEMLSFPKTLSALTKQQLPEVARYSHFGYGLWAFGSSLPLIPRMDLMLENYQTTQTNRKSATHLFFYVL